MRTGPAIPCGVLAEPSRTLLWEGGRVNTISSLDILVLFLSFFVFVVVDRAYGASGEPICHAPAVIFCDDFENGILPGVWQDGYNPDEGGWWWRWRRLRSASRSGC